MEHVHTPLLVMHGTDDQVTPLAGSEELAVRAYSWDKTLKLYDGLFHDLLHEPEHEKVTADIVAWLDARVAR
jgi:acylglycerol lipase